MIDLFKHRVLILLGKGGVGKTTVSAAIATMVARAGNRVLVMECDSHAPMSSLFGNKRSFEPIEAAPRLFLMVLDGRHSLEEYLKLVLPGRAVLNAVFASRLYQYFVQAAPGLRELMMLGKVYYEVEQKPRASGDKSIWDHLILDAPASGQALNLLKMPAVARETFGESIVGREAKSITAMLHDESRCAIIQVTTPDPLSLNETLETNAALSGLELKVAAVILNRRNPAAFDADDLARFANNPNLVRKLKTMDRLCELARAELDRAAVSRDALAQLRERTRSPVIEIGEHPGRSGLDLVAALADDLARSPAFAGEGRGTRGVPGGP